MQPKASRGPEVAAKLQRLRAIMPMHGVDAIALHQLSNIAWLTAGAATFVDTSTDTGPSFLLITPDQAYVITDRIEAPRLEQEESLPALGFTMTVEPWAERGSQVTALVASQRLGQDGPGAGIDLGEALQTLRTQLQPEEVARLRHIGTLASETLAEVMHAIQPGMTEHAIAGMVAAASRTRGGQALVNLVASDERIASFRHPLPSVKVVDRYVMAVLCLRHEGLIAAVTRLVHFGPLPEELAIKAQAVANVDAQIILGTRVGKTMGDMYECAAQAYRDAGFPDAIYEHHQGGSIAYLTREVVALPHDPTPIRAHQAFAWNPSVRGVKSEDTILLGTESAEIITATPGWPRWEITSAGQMIARPAILVR